MIKWEEMRLREVSKVISGYAFSSNDFNNNEGVPVIKIANIGNGTVEFDNSTQYVCKDFLTTLDKKYIIKNGDVLISLTGSHITQPNSMVGRTAMYRKSYDALLNQRAGKITGIKNKGVEKFLYYNLRTQWIREYIGVIAHGAANQANISPKSIESIKTLIPPVKIQEKIADVLSVYDELIENNINKIELLEKTAETIYKEWFVRFRFPGYHNTHFKNGIPKGWTVKKINDFGRVETGKTPPTVNPQNYGGNIMFIKTPDMHGHAYVVETGEYLTKTGHETQPKKLLPSNSISVSCIGTGGIVAINSEPAHTNQQINSIILDDLTYLEWLYFTAKVLKPTIEMFGATGATMTNLSKGKFEKIKVICPNKELIYDFNQITSPMLEEIKELQKQNRNLVKQRDLLLPRLMSGKLMVK